MMKRFKDFILESNDYTMDYLTEDVMLLAEKLIMFNQGKKYGQVVFMAGGAGSGKGFASKNFMEVNKFKVRDVDEWKKAFMAMSTDKRFREYGAVVYRDKKGKITAVDVDHEGGAIIKDREDATGIRLGDLDLKNPEHVFILHLAIKEMGIKHKTLELLLSDLKQAYLPNILFDVTLKEIDDITDVLPTLLEVGYESRNIHIVWVLTNYHVAVRANKDRERVVPDDILLKTHEGAANTMYDLIKANGVPGLDGSVHVILNNRDQTIFWERPDGTKTDTVKGFTYLTLKKEGQKFYDKNEVNTQLLDWIKDNIPRTKQTAHMWGG